MKIVSKTTTVGLYNSEKDICNFQKNNFVKLVMDYSLCSSELGESNTSYRSENSILGSSDKLFENRPYQCQICDEEFLKEMN